MTFDVGHAIAELDEVLLDPAGALVFKPSLLEVIDTRGIPTGAGDRGQDLGRSDAAAFGALVSAAMLLEVFLGAVDAIVFVRHATAVPLR